MAIMNKTYIRDMLIDKKNNLWIITGRPNDNLFVGMNKYNTSIALIIKKSSDQIEIFDNKNGFNAKAYYNLIFEDSKGRIWIGSPNNGVFMYEYDDLPSNKI